MSKNELVIIGCSEGKAKTSSFIESINIMLAQHNKVIFLSYECSKENIIDRFTTTDNLIIYDEIIKDVQDIRKYIEDYKPNYLYIDYLQLIPNYNEAIYELKKMVDEYNLNIFVNLILTNEELKLSGEILKANNSICKLSDRVVVFMDFLHKSNNK